jgi:hypothetical protein
MTLHPVIIYYDEDVGEFEYLDWEDKHHNDQAWAVNSLVWLSDAEYKIIISWKIAQALMEQKCRGYKPKKPEGSK